MSIPSNKAIFVPLLSILILFGRLEASEAATINLRTEFNGNEWTGEVQTIFDAQQKRVVEALHRPENAKLAADVAAQNERISKEADLVRLSAAKRAELAAIRKDEFETSAQFQSRLSAAQAASNQAQAEIDQLRRQIAANDVGGRLDALANTVTTSIRVSIVTDTPTYNADRRSLGGKACIGVETHNLAPSALGEPTPVPREYDNYKIKIAVQSKEMAPSQTLEISNIPDVNAAKLLKQTLAIGTGIPNQDAAWRASEGLVLKGEAVVRYSQQVNVGGVAGALLLGGGMRSKETIHTFIVDFVKPPEISIPEYSRDLKEGGMESKLR